LDRVEQDNKTVQYDAGIIHQTIKY
jgi:hypothetical protein